MDKNKREIEIPRIIKSTTAPDFVYTIKKIEHISIAIELKTTRKLKATKRKNSPRLPSLTSTDYQKAIDIF